MKQVRLNYELLKTKLKTILNEVDYVFLCTDGWSSISQDSYLTVTAYFIDKDWIPKRIVLTTSVLEDRETSVNIKSFLKRVIDEWQLEEKIVVVVTDNASNMVGAIKDADFISEKTNTTCTICHIKCIERTSISATYQ